MVASVISARLGQAVSAAARTVLMALLVASPGVAQDELSSPAGVSVCQVGYGPTGVVVVSWANPELYDSVEPIVDGKPAPGEVDGALGTARIEVAPGEHTFGVLGVVGDEISKPSEVSFTVLEESPVADPIRDLDCEILPVGGGRLLLTWVLGDDAWVLASLQIPGRTGTVTLAAGATEATLPARGSGPFVVLLSFKNGDGYFSEPLTALCDRRTPAFRRADCDGTGSIDITDALFTVNNLFLVAPRWSCDDACDSNDDGKLDISDPLFTLNYLFLEGPLPAFPGPQDCGIDITDDFLGGLCGCP